MSTNSSTRSNAKTWQNTTICRYDYTNLEGFPSLIDLAALEAGKESNIGWTVFTGVKNKVVRMLVSLTVQLFKQRVRFLDTNREALQFLAEMDEPLPDLSGIDLDAIWMSITAAQNAPVQAPPKQS
jgi:hypothetical protein